MKNENCILKEEDSHAWFLQLKHMQLKTKVVGGGVKFNTGDMCNWCYLPSVIHIL